MRAFVIVALGACSSPTPAPPPPTRQVEPKDAHVVKEQRRWLAGDFHMHVAPPDSDDVTASITDIERAAKTAGMDFIVLTPHLWAGEWQGNRPWWRGEWTKLARKARATQGLTMIPGTEWTTPVGHFTVVGADLAALDGTDFLGAAKAAGAYISANHPFAEPSHIPNVRISDFNLSYRVWSEHAEGFTAIDGAEVFNVPLAFGNLVSRPGGRSGEERAWTELDRVVHDEHRRMNAIGGSDDHHGVAQATTWVLADDASEGAILAALRAGRTCVGGPEAGSFRAHGDDDAWVTIGGTVTGKTITLAWDGTAHVFVDDQDRGELDGGYVDHPDDKVHTYRIVRGRSRCGFIYANL
ncbi:MAG: CehA/McbA family metallohydrolase [Kofleriaceae bacterium]